VTMNSEIYHQWEEQTANSQVGTGMSTKVLSVPLRTTLWRIQVQAFLKFPLLRAEMIMLVTHTHKYYSKLIYHHLHLRLRKKLQVESAPGSEATDYD